MDLNIGKEVAAMKRMTVNELRAKYAEVFGEETNARHKEWLVRRIAWRMQALAEGDLSERARQRAEELANDADLRTTIPKPPKAAPALADRVTTATVRWPATIVCRCRARPSHASTGGTCPRSPRFGRWLRVRGRGLQVAVGRGEEDYRHPL